MGIALDTHLLPPPANGFRRELRGVVVDATTVRLKVFENQLLREVWQFGSGLIAWKGA